jgi:hypothetical protein
MEENTKPAKYYKKRIFLFFTLFPALGLVVGVIGGYVYYLKVGCAIGSCAITSSPWLSMLWGGAMGYLIGDLLSGKKETK